MVSSPFSSSTVMVCPGRTLPERMRLLSALQAEEKAPVTVNMEEEKPDAQDNDSRRRSSGLDQLDDDVR